MKQLALAWMLYADENDNKVVNGAAGIPRLNEKPWVGKCWHDNFRLGAEDR